MLSQHFTMLISDHYDPVGPPLGKWLPGSVSC